MEQVLHNHSSVRKSNNTNAMCAISVAALKKVTYHAVSYILATLIAHTCSRTAENNLIVLACAFSADYQACH